MLASEASLAQTAPTPAERIAALKENLAQSQKQLRQSRLKPGVVYACDA